MWRESSVPKDCRGAGVSSVQERGRSPYAHLDEAANLGGRLSLGVKVGASLSATNAHTRQRILKDLLKAEELEDAQVDSGAGVGVLG